MDHSTERGGLVERRKHERFQVRAGAWAVVRPICPSSPRGQILDVSRGGLSFCYPTDGSEGPGASRELDVCLADYGFCLRGVRFKIISDFEIANGDHPAASPVKRRGLEFVELTDAQASQLTYFIENHTIPNLPPKRSKTAGAW